MTTLCMFVQCVNSSLAHFNATDEIPNLIFWEINMLAKTWNVHVPTFMPKCWRAAQCRCETVANFFVLEGELKIVLTLRHLISHHFWSKWTWLASYYICIYSSLYIYITYIIAYCSIQHTYISPPKNMQYFGSILQKVKLHVFQL